MSDPPKRRAKFEGRSNEGIYGSASETVRAGLQLRKALIEGEQSGSGKLFDPNALLARLHAEHKRGA